MRDPIFLSEADRSLVEDYVLGELSHEEATVVERRIQNDGALRQELCALQATLRLLPQAISTVEPPPELRHRILVTHALRTQILTADPLPEPSFSSVPTRPLGTWQRPSLPWGRLAAGLAALIALLLGLDNLRLRQAISEAEQETAEALAAEEPLAANILQRPNSRLVALEGEDEIDATGTLLFTPGQWQQIVVAMGDLPPLPPEEIYRMWLTLENGQVIFCGEFNTDAQGRVFVELNPAEDVPRGVKATGVFVTVEPANSAIEPTGEEVVTGTL
jgi:hypothetical protein